MKNLILSGGGINGISHLGSIKILFMNNLLNKIENYCGSSIGSVICFFLYIGYSYYDIYYIIIKMDLEILIDEDIFNFLENYSIIQGKKFELLLRILLEKKYKKKRVTLQELYEKTKKIFHIVAFNLSESSEIIFNYKTTPNVDIIDAIMGSVSIPFILRPRKINNNLIVDNFFVNNYPVNIFKDDLKNTIGINLKRPKTTTDNIDSLQDYILLLFSCTNNIIKNNKPHYKPKINIEVPCTINPLHLDLTLEEKEYLFNNGVNKTMEIINLKLKKKIFFYLLHFKNRTLQQWHKLYYKFYRNI